MDRFAVGAAVTVEIDYVDYNGATFVPTAVTYTLIDESETVLAGPTAIDGPYLSSASISIAAELNSPAGGREVILHMTNADGEAYASATYQVRDRQRLVVLENTFQTYLKAQLRANDLLNLSGWEDATPDQRMSALEIAYKRLTRFAYRVRWPQMADSQSIFVMNRHARITPQMWPLMTEAEFAPYPIQIRTALERAQVIEANAILTSDPIGEKLRLGLSAEKVGESSMTFRAGIRPLDFGVHRDTFEEIKTYLDYRLTITRSP